MRRVNATSISFLISQESHTITEWKTTSAAPLLSKPKSFSPKQVSRSRRQHAIERVNLAAHFICEPHSPILHALAAISSHHLLLRICITRPGISKKIGVSPLTDNHVNTTLGLTNTRSHILGQCYSPREKKRLVIKRHVTRQTHLQLSQAMEVISAVAAFIESARQITITAGTPFPSKPYLFHFVLAYRIRVSPCCITVLVRKGKESFKH
jgi:hypothetical protein